MTESRMIDAYKEIYIFWSQNCDRLKELEAGRTRTSIVDVNIGLSYAMNSIAKLFEFDSHVEFSEALKEAGYLE